MSLHFLKFVYKLNTGRLKKLTFLILILIIVTLALAINYNNKQFPNNFYSGSSYKYLKQDLYNVINRNKLENNTIILTVANYGYRHFTYNWALSLQNNKYSRFVIFSYDSKLIDYLSGKGFAKHLALVPREWLDHNVSLEFSSFSEKEYNLLVQSKVNVWVKLLELNYSIIFSDPDVVWLSPHIVEHIRLSLAMRDSDVAFSTDQVEHICNTGMFYAKPTQFVISLFKKTIIEQNKNPETSMEQFVMGKYLLESNLLYDRRIINLDQLLYASGNVFFHLKLNAKYNVKPFTVHANFLSGYKGKSNAMKLANLWYHNDET